jgi:branched-chain amino acid transport system permease protein
VTHLLQALVLGLLIGGVYALMASGLTLIFGVMNVINVAHGAFLVLVAYATWRIWSLTGADPILLGLVMAPLMFGFGWLLYQGVLRRISAAPPSMSVLLTFGLAITIEGFLSLTAGNYFRSAAPGYFDEAFRVGSLALPKAQVYGCVAAVVVLVAMYLLLTRTWIGRAIRATSENPSGAALVGVNPQSTAAFAFAIGTATAGVGGAVLSVLYPFFPASHYDWISRLLGIIVLGGMGSLPGALLGAVVLGLAETLTATYGSLRWSTLVFYIVIVVVLLVRPHGIFGARLREDVAT